MYICIYIYRGSGKVAADKQHYKRLQTLETVGAKRTIKNKSSSTPRQCLVLVEPASSMFESTCHVQEQQGFGKLRTAIQAQALESDMEVSKMGAPKQTATYYAPCHKDFQKRSPISGNSPVPELPPNFQCHFKASGSQVARVVHNEVHAAQSSLV